MKKKVTKNDIKCFLNYENKLNWSDFDQFKDEAFKLYRIYLDMNDWRNSECNCVSFLKEYKCKHVIGISIRLKLAKVPIEAKNIEMGKNKKRGRPPKAKPALAK